MKELKICTHYNINGETITEFPASTHNQKNIEPIYEIIEGWGDPVFSIRSWKDLPEACIKYLRRIEQLIGVPVSILSTSPERSDTILIKDPYGE
jgi:adenylosuccinate synthase